MLGAFFLVRGRLITLEPKHGVSEQIYKVQFKDGILGFQINKRLDSSLLLHAIQCSSYWRVLKKTTLVWN
jgi:hypothetical protein